MLSRLFMLFCLLAAYSTSICQTTLSPGDIAVIGIKTNTSTDGGNDAIKLVTLVPLSCTTSFIVTDNNWKNTATIGWSCADDEFAIQITVTSPVLAGSIIYIDVDAAGGTASSSTGTITKTNLGSPWGTNYGLNSGGDNVFVLQGTRATPVFIYGLKHNGAFSVADCTSGGTPKNNTSLPAGLALGTSAIVMASSQDQWHFNCSNNSTTRSDLLNTISNNANWINTANQDWSANSCVINVTDGTFQSAGTLAVSGAGCGCLSSCNLNQYGSVNCGAGVSGNCSAGYQAMSRLISVPAGCTYTVSATMRPRSGCSSSGADDNCSTCDVVKVDIVAGAKSVQQGGGNSTISDSYTLIGPGTIEVSGRANRADEIITYTVSISPCGCLSTALPIEITDFDAKKVASSVLLTWETLSERDNDYFTIERSIDGSNWEQLFVIKGQGNSSSLYSYSIYDSSPFDGLSYYRLTQTDFDGYISVFDIASVQFVEPTVVAQYNLLGQPIDENYSGIIIQIMDNGDVVKAVRKL